MARHKVAAVIAYILREGKLDAQPNNRGNQVIRLRAEEDRYIIDFAPDFAAEGWEQFDTSQDAHYFGVWVNYSKRMTLSYAGGDWTLVLCPTLETYLAEIKDAIRFYDEGSIASCHGTGGSVVVRQDRQRFLTGEPQIGLAEVLAVAL